jgi:putative tricarboxylic transport membrane protein
LTLGIPGEVFAAVLLGALMLQGLYPGPLLFRDNAHIVYGIFMGGLFSTMVVYIFARFSIRLAVKVINVPKSIVSPIVLILCAVGSYAIRSSVFDIFVMFWFGLLGYFMIKMDYPTPPLLIAFILSPVGEQALRQSLLISHGSLWIFFNSWISVGFLILAIFVIIGTVYRQRKLKREGIMENK